ncbi:MAG: amino acid racemase [Candidatus Bathyarchaeota archaeon]|nr:amino acid racemase [Candidatus Bathyarchaeota archaeon]
MYKRIGILGGLTPESTVPYYLHIIHRYEEMFHNHAYPEVVIFSVSFQKFDDWMEREDWESMELELAKGLRALHGAGADFAVIATNTMHNLYEKLDRWNIIPLLSLVDATATEVKKTGIKRVGLIGTKFAMNKPYYREGLAKFGIKVIVPDKEDQAYIGKVIFEELSYGILKEESRRDYLEIMERLKEKGAQGIILGCTEIPLLIKQEYTKIPVFDTTSIHAEAALQHALKS